MKMSSPQDEALYLVDFSSVVLYLLLNGIDTMEFLRLSINNMFCLANANANAKKNTWDAEVRSHKVQILCYFAQTFKFVSVNRSGVI